MFHIALCWDFCTFSLLEQFLYGQLSYTWLASSPRTERHFSFETSFETKNVTLLTLTIWFRNRFRNQKCHTLLVAANFSELFEAC